jgi:hypothetical protein
MAAGDLVYGTRTALAFISRLHSDTNNLATAFGEIDNATTTLARNYNIHIKVPISSSATAGTYDLYMVESQDGLEWTDGIDPATDADYADFIKDAILIKQAPTVYDNSPTGARINVEFHFNVCDYVSDVAPFFGFVLVNKSAQTIPSSGADGDSRSIKTAAA